MARKNTVTLQSPDRGCTAVSVEGVEYEGKKGRFEDIAPHHAAVLQKRPFNFVVATAAPDEEDEADDSDFSRMSKAELIDFITSRGGEADRKVSKDELIARATAVQDVESKDE